jgi:hypothetical protein
VAGDDEEKVAEDLVPMLPNNAGSLVDEGSEKIIKKIIKKEIFFSSFLRK